jgi:uncharacterized protein (DUF952 family)
MDRPRHVYHLVPANLWAHAESSGSAYAPPSFRERGFIQFADDPGQLRQFALAAQEREGRGPFVILEVGLGWGVESV